MTLECVLNAGSPSPASGLRFDATDATGEPAQILRQPAAGWFPALTASIPTKISSVVVLRRAAPADAPVLARIYIESWNSGFGHLMGIREVTQDVVDRWTLDLGGGAAEWIVAERDDVIVGFVGVGPSRDPLDPELGEVDTIAVDPSHRRTGVGRLLMEEALRLLRRRFKGAIVWTAAHYEQGDAFYRATGWVPLERSRADGQEVAFGRSFE